MEPRLVSSHPVHSTSRSSLSRFTAPTLERTPPSSIRSFNTISHRRQATFVPVDSFERLRGAFVAIRATRVRIHRRWTGAGGSFLRPIEGRRGADTRTRRRRAIARFEDAKRCMKQRRRTCNVATVVRGRVRRRRDDHRCKRAHVDGSHVRFLVLVRLEEAFLLPPRHRKALPA